jgi:hypothetical protein
MNFPECGLYKQTAKPCGAATHPGLKIVGKLFVGDLLREEQGRIWDNF